MYATLGWTTAILLLIITGPYWLMLLNKKVLKTKNPNFFKAVKALRKIHKPLGIIVVIVGLTHGYLALGSIRMHTGTLLWLAMLITAISGISFYLTKKKEIFKAHKILVLITVLLLLLHLFVPGALHGLF